MSRIDVFLAENGFCESRSLGARLVEAGFVYCNGTLVSKPSQPVLPGDEIAIRENPLTRFVSRGGLKLEAALEGFQVSPAGKICVDIGASTGGFTDCLLQHGAEKVYAVDSGTGQLHPSLKNNACVISMENTNARFLNESMVEPCDLAVMDVSFISQSLLYSAVCRVLKPEGVFISLIKPQFEVGREHLSKNGIVRDARAREAAILHLKEEAKKHRLVLKETLPSPITGGDGNTEYLAYFEREKA